MSTINAELQDLFLKTDGERIADPEQWWQLRSHWLSLILRLEYGHLPPVPRNAYAEILHANTLSDPKGAQHARYRIVLEGTPQPFWFLMDVVMPPGDGPFPVVLNGDACWRFLSREIERDILEHGYALATFDRTEIVPDDQRTERDRALHQVYADGDYGALAAWAWGYHRCVDVLSTLPKLDGSRIAVVGHSRGGKASLLAGATDERIALTAANNSGCGGAGSFRVQGENCEKLENILGVFPYWFTPALNDFIGRDVELPFDQHAVKALVAPRALFTTEALGDLWANPVGSYQTFLAAREVYRFLEVEDRIGIWFRTGEHDHRREDWNAFLDFADWTFFGKDAGYSFAPDPFPSMAPAFEWKSPLRIRANADAVSDGEK